MKTHLNNIKKQSKTERSRERESKRDGEYNHNFMQSPFQRFSSFL